MALTHEGRWRQNEAKDALFSVMNPGDSRTVNEDIRSDGNIRVNVKRWDFPFAHINNWWEYMAGKARSMGLPSNDPDILYGKVERRGHGGNIGFKLEQGNRRGRL